MIYTYKRASKAMFITSFTTAMAFIATGLSELVPISSFGYFSATIIPVNYMLVIVFYPATIVLFEKYIKGKFCVCN